MKIIFHTLISTGLLLLIIYGVKAFCKRKKWFTYVIPKGKHYSSNRVFRFAKKEIRFLVKFDGTAAYIFSGEDYNDINKLYGFSEGFKNSVRIGWNYKLGMIRLYPYVHRDGINEGAKDPDHFYSCIPGMELRCVITALNDTYLISINDVSVVVPRGKGGKIRWYNYPYFGGNQTAPNLIKIQIKDL